MTPDGLYTFYFAELKDIDAQYMGFEITMSLAIITILGWFLTSENAQKIIATNRTIRIGFLTAIGLTALAELYVVCLVFNHSENVFSIVQEAAKNTLLVKGHENYYDYRQVSIWTLIVFYLFHVLLLTVLSGFITKIEPPEMKNERDKDTEGIKN